MASEQISSFSSGVSESGTAGMAQQRLQHSQQQMKPHMQHQQLQMFWQHQNQEMEQLNEKSSKADLLMTHLTAFRNQQLPLARIKKIMKSDEDVKVEGFYREMADMYLRGRILKLKPSSSGYTKKWMHVSAQTMREENKRRTLQRNDIAGAVTKGDIFDFLVDIVPSDEAKEEETAVAWSEGEQVHYGGMYYPSMPAATVQYQQGIPDMAVHSNMDPNQQPLYVATQQGDMR